MLPALRRSRNMLAHPGPAANEVAQFVVASAIACRRRGAFQSQHRSTSAFDAAMVLLKSVVEIATRPMSHPPAELGPDRSGISVMAVCCDPVRGDAGHRFGGSKECLGGSQIAVLAQHDIDQGSRHQRPMSTDAGTEEHRVSGTLLPMPRRIAQLPSLPVPDAPTCSCCRAALAARAEDRDCPPYSGNP